MAILLRLSEIKVRSDHSTGLHSSESERITTVLLTICLTWWAMTTAKRKPIGFRDVHFSRCLYLLIGFFLTSSAFGQYWMELKSPAQASPCVDYPVEVTLYNDGADKTTLSRFERSLPSGLS